ncbi:hypothetical protein MANES_15G135402v8, partial [Manihot esculenta]
MKQQADKQRSKRSFEIGDWVFLKLQSYRETSLAIRKSLKLSAKYYRPFQIIAKIGQVAYKLQIPPTAHIYPIFHFFLLKKTTGANISPMPNLPIMVAPESILKPRTILRNDQRVQQGLIKWVNLSLEDATWEDRTSISAQFPDFTTSWGQEGSHEGGIVKYYRRRKR